MLSAHSLVSKTTSFTCGQVHDSLERGLSLRCPEGALVLVGQLVPGEAPERVADLVRAPGAARHGRTLDPPPHTHTL